MNKFLFLITLFIVGCSAGSRPPDSITTYIANQKFDVRFGEQGEFVPFPGQFIISFLDSKLVNFDYTDSSNAAGCGNDRESGVFTYDRPFPTSAQPTATRVTLYNPQYIKGCIVNEIVLDVFYVPYINQQGVQSFYYDVKLFSDRYSLNPRQN